MIQFFRKVRRDLCRFILGFDNCPKGYKKNFAEKVQQFFQIILFALITALIFLQFVFIAI